jgi:uncharacterized membrane protein YcgQ (UPF0703/DUF1980 family)
MPKINAVDFSIDKINKKDFKQSVIKRSNLTNEFTLRDIETHLSQIEKMERELKAQVKLTTAVIDNIKKNHGFISKMSDEQLHTAAYLYENKTVLNEADKKLKEVSRTKKNYKEVIDTIYKKFGFVESNILKNESAK